MDARTALLMIRALVERQANDEGLWFVPQYISEEILMAGLRELHALIENLSDEVAKTDEKADLCDRHGNQMIWPDGYALEEDMCRCDLDMPEYVCRRCTRKSMKL